jgi:hypothetical protein
LFENNFEFSYLWDCQLKGVLQHHETLQTYLLQYANRSFFENEKQNTTFWIILGKISIFTFNIKIWKCTKETTMNEDVLKCMKYVEHDFKDGMQDGILK